MLMNMLPKHTSKGFTLVELIVVITIIGILVAIGVISWSGAQNTAKQNAAKTTLAKMKLSLSDYFTDNNAYPTSKSAICDAPTYSVVSAGDLYTEYCTGTNASYYLYAPSPSGCDNTATKCTLYTLTAQKAIWNGATDETLQP